MKDESMSAPSDFFSVLNVMLSSSSDKEDALGESSWQIAAKK